jgi:hypothetical protein
MARTQADHNRAIRKDALREQLANGKHLEHVIDMANKIADHDELIESDMLARYKIAIDTKLRLINKYLPDVKAVEITGEDGGPVLYTKTKVELVRSPHPDA